MSAKIRIIDNKKISLTDQEYELYNKLCQHYTKPHQKGEEYFRELFETNNDGIIVFLKPPTVRQVSMEILMFVVNVMHHQHLRAFGEEFSLLKKEVLSLMKELQEAKSELNKLKESK